MSANQLPDLTARVRLDTTELDQGVQKAAGIGAGIGGAIGGFAAGGIQTAISGITTFAKGSVDAFAAVEDATGAAGVQFGKALPDVLAFADKASSSFGLSKRAALDAENTFATLGKAAGLQGQPLAAFSGKLTGLAGDLASFRGTSTEQAITAVGAALRGETEPIRAYGVMLNDASIQAEGLALGLVKPVINADKLAAAHTRVTLATKTLNEAVKAHGKNSDEAQRAQLALTSATNAQNAAAAGSTPPLSANNKALAVQSLILKQTKDAQGDYARTSSSTANVQKTLAAETENAQAALGAKLAPAITAVREGLLVLIRGLAGGVDVFSKIVGVVQSVIGVFQTVVGFVRDNAVAFGILAAAVLAVTAPYLASVIAINAQVAAFLIQQTVINGVAAVTRAYAAVQAALNAVMEANPIGLIIVALALLAAGIVLAWQHSETFRDVVTSVWEAIKGVVAPVLDFLTVQVPAAFGAVKDAITGAVEAVLGFISDHWPLLLDLFLGPIGVLINAVIENWTTIKNATSALWDGIKAVISTVVNAIKAVVMLVFDGIKAYIGLWTSAISAVISAVWGVIGGTVTTALNGIKATVETVLGAVKTVFSTAWDAIKTTVTGAIDKVVEAVTGIGSKIKGAASGAFDGIKDAFRAAINFIIDGWNSLHFHMPEVDTHIPGVGKVGGFDLGLPNIPRLAEGGIVKATRGGRLALVGEGGRDEAVVPLGRGGGFSSDDIVTELRALREEVAATNDKYLTLARKGAVA